MRFLTPVLSSLPKSAFIKAGVGLLDAGRSLASASARLSREYPDRVSVLTDGGTSALALGLAWSSRAAAIRLVALPAYGCPDLGTAAVAAGFRIHLYDLDPRTFAPDLASLRRAFAAGATHAVIAHFYGHIIDPSPASELALESGGIVIEDAAQHAGGRLGALRAGSLAEWSILSFGRGKGLNAGGGGALMVSHRMAERLSQASTLPRMGAGASARILAEAYLTSLLSHPSLFGVVRRIPTLAIGETRYHSPTQARLLSASSAILLVEALELESQQLSERVARDLELTELLQGIVGVRSIRPATGTTAGALRHPFLVARSVRQAASALQPLGVVRGYPRLLNAYLELQPHIVNATTVFPGAAELAQSLYTAPTHQRTKSADLKAMAAALRGSR